MNSPDKDVANQCSIPGSTLFTETKRVETGTCKKLNEVLLKWFVSMRGNNIPLNDPILLEKAIEKDIKVSGKKNLYILLLLSLYNALHREENSPAYFFQNLTQIIWTPIIRISNFEILNPLEDSNYTSSTFLTFFIDSYSCDLDITPFKLINSMLRNLLHFRERK